MIPTVEGHKQLQTTSAIPDISDGMEYPAYISVHTLSVLVYDLCKSIVLCRP